MIFQDFKIDFIYTPILLVLYNAFVYFLGNVYSIYLYAIVSFALVIVFNIDSKYRLIPDEAHIVIVACSIVNLFFNLNMWWSYLAGAVVGGLIFWLLGLLALLIFRKEGMGFGDVKLMAALGLFFGLKNILVVTLVSFVFGAVMIILGIDPGYAIVGYGVIEFKSNRFSVVDYGAITTNAGTPFERRLELIYDDLNLLMGKFHPEAMSIEKLFYNTNAKTVIDVAQARGVTVLAAKKNNIPIFEYTPLQVKQSVVGYGRAEKKQVQEMTRIILKLAKIPKPDDTADALAMAICHAHASGSLMGKLNSMGIR